MGSIYDLSYAPHAHSLITWLIRNKRTYKKQTKKQRFWGTLLMNRLQQFQFHLDIAWLIRNKGTYKNTNEKQKYSEGHVSNPKIAPSIKY
jgi:hypothetical protein